MKPLTFRDRIGLLQAFCLDFLLRTLCGAVGVAIAFLPFAIVSALITRDWLLLYFLPLIGSFLGALCGGGHTFVVWFSDPEFVPDETENSFGESCVQMYGAAFEPKLFKVLRILHWLVTNDYSRARPGRARRAAVAALGGACFGLMLVGISAKILPHVHSPPAVTLFGVLCPTVMAGIAGALSDSY